MDLEILTINRELDPEAKAQFFETGGQCEGDAYKRAVTRQTNEVGRWERLIKELTQIASDHSIELDKCLEMFESVSCSKTHLRDLLQKNSYTSWTMLDDLGL
jgi:hypothetical protein